jgi:small-conductance mechanosensitive channel
VNDSVNDSANDSASDSVNDNASDSVNETADLAPGKLGGRGWRDIFLYGLARLVLFIVLTVVIQLIAVLLGMGQSFPLAISALLALIIAFPLSRFVFKDLRLRVNEHLAVRDAGRRAHKDQMRAQLEERQD